MRIYDPQKKISLIGNCLFRDVARYDFPTFSLDTTKKKYGNRPICPTDSKRIVPEISGDKIKKGAQTGCLSL
jgi:hypothetical protein